jgi:hypothetical protein
LQQTINGKTWLTSIISRHSAKIVVKLVPPIVGRLEPVLLEQLIQ